MEIAQDIVIVGAGVAGLATSLGLHRLGIRSLVLESADNLRTTGFALGMWTNAWKALDSLGIGDVLRQEHVQINCLTAISMISGQPLTTLEQCLTAKGSNGDHELRCVNRKLLLETLEKELPRDTIRFSSKVVGIEDSGYFRLIHLADGTILRTKVLIGCDGVNSVVAKYLGLGEPYFPKRSAIRGCSTFKDGHGFEPKFLQFFGKGVRCGLLPTNHTDIYWFLAYAPSLQDKEMEDDPIKLKQFVLSKVGENNEKAREVIENCQLDKIVCSPLRFRNPLELLWRNLSKDNVCVAGDALHPMTPDLGQGGCAALEDSVVLARCLAKAFVTRENGERKESEKDEFKRIKIGVKQFVKERRWRSFSLVSTAYIIGHLLQADGKMMKFIMDKIPPKFYVGILLKKAEFDCGNLN